MFGILQRGSLLGDSLTQWQFDCFAWLLRHTGGMPAFRARRLVLPTPQYFPQRSTDGRALARAMFEQVKHYADMKDWPCGLEEQDADPDIRVAPTLLVRDAPASPAGTFRRADNGVVITYSPASLGDPMSLVATFAHELAHYRTAAFAEPPPGGWEVWEPATDLTAAFLGFGIFLANSRFNFSQHRDSDSIGWSWRRQGYLSEPEVLHAHAMFCALQGLAADMSLPHLKPSLRGIFKRVVKDVQRQYATLARMSTESMESMEGQAQHQVLERTGQA